MRRLLHLVAILGVLTTPAAASAEPAFVFTGHGWGHGIGMAQYGAYGFAQKGWKHKRILAHYYRGTELGPAPLATIRVLLATGKRLTITSAGSFRIRDASGFAAEVPAGSLTLDSSLTFEGENGSRTLAPPVRLLPGSSPLELGKPYRGSIVVTPADGTLQAVNRLPLERYLAGVVPGEMPPDWHMEALKVQAIAARTYALVSRRDSGTFDVFADTRSQVYGGILSENPRTTEAVNATTGQVVLYDGKLAWTFYSASSGGRTASIQDVWPDAEPLPYLVSVDDPHDTISPYHDWGPINVTAAELRRKLGERIPKTITSIRVDANDSGRAGSMTVVGPNGETTIPGWEVRSALGLRSSWFRVDMLEMQPSASRIVFGKKVALRGRLRGLERATLERRPAGGGWARAGRVEPGRSGRFTVVRQPRVTTSFRLRASGVVGPVLRVRVAPRIALRRGDGASVLAGDVSPGRSGTPVTIQRRTADGWKTLKTAVTGSDGRFRARLALRPGAYRALVPAGRGLVPGASRVLRLS
jgi:stage II sporulation protein D